MKKLLIALGITLLATGAQATALNSAIVAAYSANDTVQRALDLDYCTDDEVLVVMGISDAYRNLSHGDQQAYDVVEDALRIAYSEADEEQTRLQFCAAMGER